MDLRLLVVGVSLILLLGCLAIPKAPSGENISVEIDEGANVTGVSIDEIVIPEINESEGEFPLPV